ncbi:MAG: DegT/DnrJ/EryC1/StrS family aminotransferase [Thermoleophilia bacterium]
MTEIAVPLFDIRLSDEDVAAVERTLRSGWLTMGPRTEEFENAFAAALGARHAVATSSCTAALHLAYLAAGVGPGDEVVVPAITFVATAAAARYCGAEPVIADVVGDADFGIDPAHVAALLTPRTKAVCAVHYGGYAAAVEDLRRLCDERGLALIEDAAHSPSATTAGGGRKLGTYGLAGAFSFFSNKVLSCGEGGLLATDDDDAAQLARSRRSHAMTSGTWDRHRGHVLGYDVVDVGFNYRLDEPRAALLLSRLARLEADIAARRRRTHGYRERLAAIPGVGLPYPPCAVDASSCYVMPVLLDEGIDRDRVRSQMMQRHGVQTSVLYPAVHEFTAYATTTGSLPRAEAIARRQLTLPLFAHITEGQQDLVVEALDEALRARP